MVFNLFFNPASYLTYSRDNRRVCRRYICFHGRQSPIVRVVSCHPLSCSRQTQSSKTFRRETEETNRFPPVTTMSRTFTKKPYAIHNYCVFTVKTIVSVSSYRRPHQKHHCIASG